MGKRFGALIGAVVAIVLVGPGSADAATFDVDSTADVAHVGGCTVAPGDCSLRDAITAANGSADPTSTVNVPAGTYPVTAGQIESDGNTAIVGADARTTIVDAGGLSRVFYISDGDASISGLTITGGSASDTGAGPETGDGGGILVVGGLLTGNPSLTLTDSAVVGNSAAFNGAGLALPSFHTGGGGTETSELTVTRSTIANNHLTGGTVPTAVIVEFSTVRFP